MDLSSFYSLTMIIGGHTEHAKIQYTMNPCTHPYAPPPQRIVTKVALPFTNCQTRSYCWDGWFPATLKEYDPSKLSRVCMSTRVVHASVCTCVCVCACVCVCVMPTYE